MTPAALRETIPVLDRLTYMNYGATGPSPRPVVEAATTFLEHHEYEAAGREGMYPAAFGAYEDVREAVASFVGVQSTEIALTQSTADGINRVACALPWESGDVVVRTDMEHPAGILPWERLHRTRGVDVRVVESDHGRLQMDAYKKAVRGARLVLLSALTWNYGTRLPIAELVDIAHDAGAFVLVDAVQWPGQAPADYQAWGADAVAGAGHKWLLGPWGAGFLYVQEEIAETLEPGTIGYRSVSDSQAAEYELAPGATRFEIGTINPAPHMALREAVSLFEDIGLGTIESRIQRLASQLVDGLPDRRVLSPLEPESGLVTIEVDDPEHVVEAVKEDGFVLRSLPDPEALRVSVHAVNTIEEIEALLDALEPYLE